ncbi:MAG: orotidine-5'-phosphate decarboxylase [Candidatus Bathyarchaeia archaeon]
MREASRARRSRIVLALDVVARDPEALLTKSLETLELVSPHICAVKVNRQLTLPLGLYGGTKKVLKLAKTLDLPVIMDCKINDIGNTNREIARHYYRAGFDAVTANPFVGWLDGLHSVFELARDAGKGVILLVYMSHRGAKEGYGQQVIDSETKRAQLQYQAFAERALRWGADGVVVGATNLGVVREVRVILGGAIPIFSPGVGVQGGDAGAAVEAGADFIIVGRSIVLAENPAEAAKGFKDLARRAENTR